MSAVQHLHLCLLVHSAILTVVRAEEEAIVEDLRLTPSERGRIRDVCTWVEIKASFLPYLREYLAIRLADTPELAAKVARLDKRGTYHLWEWIKDEQLRPILSESEASEVPATRTIEQPWPLV